MHLIVRRACVVCAAAAVAAPAASAAPFRLTLPRLPTGTALDRLPPWTFAADTLPNGFVAKPLPAPATGVALTHPSSVFVRLEAFGTHDIFPIVAPPARIAPAGAIVAADGSWTLPGQVDRFGLFAPDSGKKIWLEGTIAVSGGDVQTPAPDQVAAIDAIKSALRPSLRAWYGLDPRTTSDANRTAVITAVAAAIGRTAHLRDWSATLDEASLVKRQGPLKVHAVYAVRERNGRIAVSSADVPGVRRIHKPGRSWTYVPAGRCWQGSKDLGEAPLPVHEREAVRSGPAALQLVGNGQRGLNSTIFGSLRALRLAYDVTAKSPLSRGARPTRYELYVYYGFRVHLIVDVNRHGIATVIKEEQLDARGLVVERERIGIATPAARRLLAPGRSC